MEKCENPVCVELRIPCQPEYVGVARLTLLGIASRMHFTYDEVEDIRLAVGEACTASIEWAARSNRSDSIIVLRSHVSDEKLIVDIIDDAGDRGTESLESDPDQAADNIGALLVTLLVDEVDIRHSDTGTHVRMVKYARRG